MKSQIVASIVEASIKRAAGSKDPAAKNPVLQKSDLDKDLAPVKGSKSMSGLPKTTVDPKPQLYGARVFESVVVNFGRMNPPTVGHERLVREMHALAENTGADVRLYLSHTGGKTRDPLVYESKLEWATIAFGDIVVESDANCIMSVAAELSESYDHLYVVCGSDRAAEFEKKLNQYNGRNYQFESIHVHSLDRDGDTLEESVSASAAREHAALMDLESFTACLASPLREFAEELYAEVRGELQELTVVQRTKRAQAMRRNKVRLKTGRARAMARRAPSAAIYKRARRLAIRHLRSRILRGQRYDELGYGQRQMVDEKLKRRKKSITKLAKRLAPKVARAEAGRKLGHGFGSVKENVQESVELMLAMLSTNASYQLSEQETASLAEQAALHDTTPEILETVFRRGLAEWTADSGLTLQQTGFARVNSFLFEGTAWHRDFDLVVEDCGNKYAHADDEGAEDPLVRSIVDAQKSSEVEATHGKTRDSVPHRIVGLPSSVTRQQTIRRIIEGVGVPNLEDGVGKRRVDLPQLTDFHSFSKDLDESGIKMTTNVAKPSTLTPTQKHFNQEKVESLKGGGWDAKPIIVSNDDYVIDGHHRWLAAHQLDKDIRVQRVDMKCQDLLAFVKGKPYTENKTLKEERE